ncbi:MAG: M3 family oligoendopeptidase [Polyangiaceae bacterium]|nr:M3 family oligoendopeptidase [Polyangiaceae bacterium]
MLSTRWDLEAFFPTFDSQERRSFEDTLLSDAAALLADATKLGPLAADGAGDPAWEALLLRFEKLMARLSHLSTYVTCLASEDAADERYTMAEGRLSIVRAQFDKLSVELRRALRPLDDAAFNRFASRPALQGARFFLIRLREESKTSMVPELEGLAADLGAHGIMGWGRLYDGVSAKMRFEMRWPDGRRETVPMAQRRSLMADPDRAVRKAAFVHGNEAWAASADVLAPALNHIAGTRHLLNARRGVGHFLDVALHQAAISKKTLDAMFEAVLSKAELPRRGLRLKAKAMGVPAISWFDLEAPLPLPSAERVPFERGVDLIRGAFGRAYPRLREYFDALFERRWIESEARANKRPGAYCIGSDLTEDVRVFMTYQGSLGDISTLAHEVGHAFHAEVMRGTRIFERQYPMTLAETASTFAESLLSDGLLSDPSLSPAQRALLLGEAVGDGAAFLLDVPTRFFFEKKLYEERAAGELPASRLNELMAETQREIFGDALAKGEEDPLFWASKLHFFIPDITFYNFPYTFGFLLSRGMYAIYKTEGPAFLPRYEAFLRMTGSATAHEVAKASIGRDLESPEFWADAIETLRAPTDELERLLPSVRAS